jgi:hypothetical protein
MRTFFSILTLSVFASCKYPENKISKDVQTKAQSVDTIKIFTKNAVSVSSDITTIQNSTTKKLTILVLPPYDFIANEGISPDIQKYLEEVFASDTTVSLIKFPYRQLMNVSYQNVFDKKYCKPITEKIKTDIIIMSNLEQADGRADMRKDKWDFRIRIYNTKSGKQKNSSLSGLNLTSTEIENLINSKQHELFAETKNNR